MHKEPEALSRGATVSEIALWSPWVHRGRLYADVLSHFHAIDVEAFGKCVSQHADVYAIVVLYANCFVETFQEDKKASDLSTFDVISALDTGTDLLTFNITIVSAVGLRKSQSEGFENGDRPSAPVDAYVVCKVMPGQKANGQKAADHADRFHKHLQTNIQYNTLSPRWDFSGTLEIHGDDVLQFTVWNHQRWGADDMLGTQTLKASDFFRVGFRGDLELQGTKPGVKLSVIVDSLHHA